MAMCPTLGSSNVAQDLSLLHSTSALSYAGCGNFGRRMHDFFATLSSAPDNLIGGKKVAIGWGVTLDSANA